MPFTGYLYCVSSEYTDQHGQKKLGATMYPVQRMYQYNTGDAPGIGLEKRYDAVWQVNASNKRELLAREHTLHKAYVKQCQRRSNGNLTEWFKLSFQDVLDYMESQDWTIRRLSKEDISEIHRKAGSMDNKNSPELTEELAFMEEEQKFIQEPQYSLKMDFFQTFLPEGCVPRRIQDELWDIFEAICQTNAPYKGIVQWATGVGKTIGMLSLFLLSAEKCKKEGKTFRGLLVAPQNDIFDTIMDKIRLLKKWDIEICEGHNARFSSLQIPADRPVLITATHASLTEFNMWDKLESISHCHYDEVHRITGNEFYELLNKHIQKWGTQYVTGTSATPKTCSKSQHTKLTELFGSPLTILHKCDVDEAIREGWIAKPRFGVHILIKHKERDAVLEQFLEVIRSSIQQKQYVSWKGGKVIAYLPSQSDVKRCVQLLKIKELPYTVYSAVEKTDALTDEQFVSDPADGTPKVMFACERFREGSDIYGLEMTLILMGNVIGANIMLQVAGRALRRDYAEKEGWCIVAKLGESGITEDDILESIVLQIVDFTGESNSNGSSYPEDIRPFVRRYFGDMSLNGKVYDIEETVSRIQALYDRRDFERGNAKERYETVRRMNKEMNLQSKDEYMQRSNEHAKYIPDPKSYFKDSWISWYHFLGVNTDTYPSTKAEWIEVCKNRKIHTWEDYKKVCDTSLPANPGEMYEDYTNWNKEFTIEEEYVW